jgi:hypothetical protein
LLKTKFRDWLNGAMVTTSSDRLSLKRLNRFASLRGTMSLVTGRNDGKGIGKAFLPIALSAGLGYLRTSTVEANCYCHDGQHTFTISCRAAFDKFRSK